MRDYDDATDLVCVAATRAEAKGLLGQQVTLLPLCGEEVEQAYLRGFYVDEHDCACAVVARSLSASFCALVHVSRIEELGLSRH